MEESVAITPENIEIVDNTEYSCDVATHFTKVPDVARPLVRGAQAALQRIEHMLYAAPAFINIVKASIPEETFRAILTDDQKAKLASGALKLMTKKDGSLMANLVNPENNKIVSTISLESVNLSPALTEAVANYASQMQMAQIAEQIQLMQAAIEEVRQGQEFDRLATAYSCQQKLLQAMAIRNPELKTMALLRIVSDAEDSRNLLMQSQSANLAFIKDQPESFWGKLIKGATPEKINTRMNEIRESLNAVNMVSLTEAMAYQEMGEPEAARESLQYYAAYLQRTYLDVPRLVERLDLVDPSPENYWSKTLPEIKVRIHSLPCVADTLLIGGNSDGTIEV